MTEFDAEIDKILYRAYCTEGCTVGDVNWPTTANVSSHAREMFVITHIFTAEEKSLIMLTASILDRCKETANEQAWVNATYNDDKELDRLEECAMWQSYFARQKE